MRLLIDSLIALMLAGILGGVLWHYRQEQQQIERYQGVYRSLARLQEQITLQRAVGIAEKGAAAYPPSVSPLWFEGDLPINPLLPVSQAWLDIAPPGDLSDHPPDPIAHRSEQGGFWYNPNRGLFRARIPGRLAEADTLRLYNQINHTHLTALHESDDPARSPLPYAKAAGGAAHGGLTHQVEESPPPVTPAIWKPAAEPTPTSANGPGNTAQTPRRTLRDSD
jgi:hypothetical protein